MPRHLPVALAVFLVAAAAGCGGSDSEDRERRAVLAVMDRARDAFVAGRPEEVCALLTPHGRERSLGYGRAYEDTASCEDALAYALEVDRAPRVDSYDRELLADARFEVLDVDGSSARARVAVGTESATVELRKTPDGWRVHDSEVVPVGD